MLLLRLRRRCIVDSQGSMGRHKLQLPPQEVVIPHPTRTSLAKFQAHDKSGGHGGRVTLFSMEHGQHETIWSRETPSEPPTPYGRRLCDVPTAPIPAEKHEKLLEEEQRKKDARRAAKRDTTTHSEERARQRAAKEQFHRNQDEMRGQPKKNGMPMSQMKDMVKERMQAIMMQDRQALRHLFNQFCQSESSRAQGTLGVQDFKAALASAGIKLSDKDASRFMSKFSSKPGKMSFDDFFMGLVGLPSDFFTMTLHRAEGAESSGDSKPQQQAAKSLRPVLPASTTMSKLEKLFKMRLRERLFNVNGAVVVGLRRATQNDSHMNEDHLFQVLTHHGLMPSRKELAELMCHFDQNRDGKIEYTELACELLQLPRPAHVQHVMPFYPDRPKVSQSTRRLVHKLAIACERAAAPPARIYNLFRQFDKDGSGSIAYDEIECMVRDFGCEVEGRDAAALLLDKFTGGQGAMGYMQFITSVIGLQPDALKSDPSSSCPATPQIVEKVSDSVKKELFNSKGARNKLLQMFDPDGGGTVTLAEFQKGVHELNLPVDRKQVTQLFKQFEKAENSNGKISVMNFTKNLFGMSTHRSNKSSSSYGGTRPLPTSRGGSPCMPKEFRENRPHTSMSAVSEPPLALGGHLQPPLSPGPTKLHPMLRSGTPEPILASSRRSMTPGMSTNRSRAPTHRINNLRREPHSHYVQNFCVTDSGQDHNFSPDLVASLAGTKSRSVRSVSHRQGGLKSDVAQLPNYHLTTTYGRSHED